jgi:drug/metabolite transporter (DMT)-like permease
LLLPPSLFAGKLRGAIGTTDSGPFILGIVFCALSALLSAIFLVFSKPVAATMGPIRMLRPLYGYGFLISIAIMLIGNPNSLAANTDTLGNLASDFWMATAFIVLGSTITANMLNMYAIRRVAASTVGGFVFLQTIVGVSLSVGYLGEALEARHVVATGFIVVGLAGLTRIAWREARIQHGVPEKSGTQCDTIN